MAGARASETSEASSSLATVTETPASRPKHQRGLAESQQAPARSYFCSPRKAGASSRRSTSLSEIVRRGSDGQRPLVIDRRPLIVRTTQMEAGVTEHAVPIQNDFHARENEKCDRSEP